MNRVSKVIFDAMLLMVLLGMLVVPIGSFGLMKVQTGKQDVLSTQDILPENKQRPLPENQIRKPNLQNTGVKNYNTITEESTESTGLDAPGY